MMKNRYLISGDWHLRADKPRCRLDKDWKKTQEDILDFIFKIAAENKADVIHTGDLFDQSQVPSWVVSMFLKSLHKVIGVSIYLIAGNHDLPYNNFENVDRSSFGIIWNMLEDSDFIHSLCRLGTAIHYGGNAEYSITHNKELLFIHKLVYKNKVPPFIKDALTAQELLDMFPETKWVFTGDNHKKFVYEDKGRYVVNPGCVMRQKVDEINYEPSVYLIDFETEEVRTINIPDKIEMVTDEYIIDRKEIDERIQSFVELVKGKEGLTLSFKESLLDELKKSNKEIDYFKDIIYEIMEEVYG